MQSFTQVKKVASWAVFIIALIVYYFSAERTGSLWDVGEFILGAYKLQVVHPPGAPLFMLIGRMFTLLPDWFSSNPANIAFAVNLMSGVCTAFTAFFVAQISMLFGKSLLEKNRELTSADNFALLFVGLGAGLSTAFSSSIWFSAVEGEVYAMSTMFTAMTFWAATIWYFKPNTRQHDRWLLLSIYFGSLSIGVHLLSLLAFPAIGLMYYFKRYKNQNILGGLLSIIGGAAFIIFIQKIIIVGIPTVWKQLELLTVNGIGLPIHSGLIFTLLLLGVAFFFLFRFAHKKKSYLMQFGAMAALLSTIAFSTVGVIVIRANADTPVNMNAPSDALRLLPYLNREQYGERPLLYGPHFDAEVDDMDIEPRYGRVGDKYEITDRKISYVYKNKDKILFPRIGHAEMSRPKQHRDWYKVLNGKDLKGKPSFGYNIQYFVRYQIGWMYWRYFMWNFSGRQNAQQGHKPWDKSAGHWITGIQPFDEMMLYDMDELPDSVKSDEGTNKYFMLPFLFGLFGLIYQAFNRSKDFMVILMLFLLTGLGIILYTNQPPMEPRERDYALVGSFFTFCMWIGMGVIAVYDVLRDKIKGTVPAIIAGVLILVAPLLMAFQNFDDHSRNGHYASRDYAANFLNSVDENAIIFTYGDNDTYPLWYAQEVENIRRDVRVVNLSLITVDWYINKLNAKVNDSAPIKMTIPEDAYRGSRRNQVWFNPYTDLTQPRNVFDELNYIANPQNMQNDQTVMRTERLILPIDRQKAISSGFAEQGDSTIVDYIPIDLDSKSRYITKDVLAVMDVVVSNIYERPIYFAVTCRNDKLLGLNDYMELQGLGLRVRPYKTKSDPSLGIYGSGSVNTDKAYDNIMNRWQWGGFDKEDTFVDESYAAEIQAMKLIMMRTADTLSKTGQREKAKNLANKYFEAFPHFNFPYDNTVIPFIEILNEVGDKDSASNHIRILAEELYQQAKFIDSIDEDSFNSFKNDYSYSIKGLQEVFKLSQQIDPKLGEEMNLTYGEYNLKNLQGN